LKVLRLMIVLVVVSMAVLPLRSVFDLDTLRTPWPRWRWMRSWIVDSERRAIDHAFVGSSKTQTDIMPSELERLIPGTLTINAGHFQFGHDADYFIAEALLRLHDVDKLIIEIPEEWSERPHGRIPYLMRVGDLPGETRLAWRELTPGDILSYGPELKARASRLATYGAAAWLSFPAHAIDRIVTAIRGGSWDAVVRRAELDRVGGYAGEDRQDEEFLEVARRAPMPRFLPPTEWAATGLGRPEPGSRDDWYLRRIHVLAAKSGTDLLFVYMPSWKLPLPAIETVAYYRALGDVLIPNVTMLNQIEHYLDTRHMTTTGARLYARQLAKLLVHGANGSPYTRFYPGRLEAPPD
jgi:hypothetical protein